MIRTGSRRTAVLVATVGLIASLFVNVGSTAALATAHLWTHRDTPVCGAPAAGEATCLSIGRTLYDNGQAVAASTRSALAANASAALSVSYTAVGLRTAYGITGTGDPSKVLAIVDAYDDVNAYSNLATYRAQMGLPVINSCSLGTLTALTSSSASPCFAKVNQAGGTSLPSANAGWATEEDLDLQAASAICPNCSIILFEASSASDTNLGTAVTTASNTAHVLSISNSYGGNDVPGSVYNAWDKAALKGIAVFASTGDNGYGTEFPASSTYVLGVGGTTLNVNGAGVRTSETAWSGAGSGCSSYNAAPSWQAIPGNPCGSHKAVADLSADADPSSGLQIYTTYNGQHAWWIFGGTSLASPIMGAYYTMTGGYGGGTTASQYAWSNTPSYYDVISGSNGTCGTSVCNAGVGWDGPTGRGSISVASAGPTVPGAPTLNSATASSGQVSVSWTPPGNNGGSPVIGYNLYRSTASGAESLYRNLGNVTSYNDTAVTNGTTYYYTVSAVNGVGEGALSDEQSATPTALTGTITGTVTSANGGAAISGASVQISGGNSTTTDASGTYTFTGMAAGTYSLTASATGFNPVTNNNVTVTAGNTTTSNFVLTPVATGGSLKGKVSDATTLVGIPNATVQIVGGASTITSSTGNYAFSNVAAGTYSLTIFATGYATKTVNNVTVTSGSTTTRNVSLTPQSGSVPGAPGSLTARKAGTFSSGVKLTWTTAANNGSAITGYRIYRSTSSGSETFLATAGKNATSYSDKATISNVTYFYKVTATNANGEGPFSNEASAQAR